MTPLTRENPFSFIVPYLKFIPLVLVAALLIFFVVHMIRRNAKNTPKDHAVGKSVGARVASKRQKRRRDPNIKPYDPNYNKMITYFYYITFELDSCERVELSVPSDVYQALAEDTKGTLTYEGARYIDFIPSQW